VSRPITPGLFTIVNCLNCGKNLRSYGSSGAKKYCSRTCYSVYIRGNQKCASCGIKLKSPLSHHRKYCSNKCQGIGYRLAPGRALRNEAVSTYLRHAKARGLLWDLSDQQIDALFAGDCYWCGEPPSNRRSRKASHGDFIYNGIDRVDNTVGYINGNVVSCCFVCNSMKRDFDKDTFIRKAKLITGRWT